MSFDECELAILRHAVDETEKLQGEKVVKNDDVKKMLTIVENFIRKKHCVCYGGTAINNILPKYAQFYNKDIEGIETYISNPEFLEILKTHNKLLGKRIGVKFAEGFISKKNIGIQNFDAFIQKTT
jgi:hypothetical protein